MITVTIITFLIFMCLWVPLCALVFDVLFGFFSEYEKFIPVIGVILYIVMWLEVNKYL